MRAYYLSILLVVVLACRLTGNESSHIKIISVCQAEITYSSEFILFEESAKRNLSGNDCLKMLTDSTGTTIIVALWSLDSPMSIKKFVADSRSSAYGKYNYSTVISEELNGHSYMTFKANSIDSTAIGKYAFRKYYAYSFDDNKTKYLTFDFNARYDENDTIRLNEYANRFMHSVSIRKK